MKTKDNRGKIRITFQALADLLNLPRDAEIFGVNMSPEDLSRSQFEVYVKHPNLPFWNEGMAVPIVGIQEIIGVHNGDTSTSR